MKQPDQTRIVETYIKLEDVSSPSDTWSSLMNLLRNKVAPLIQKLQSSHLIAWYSFLIHNCPDGSGQSSIHLRMELPTNVTKEELESNLPSFCEATARMQPVDSISGLETENLRDSRIEEGWKALGDTSQWVLGILQSQAPDKPVSPQNIRQFFHFIGNQLQAHMVGLPKL